MLNEELKARVLELQGVIGEAENELAQLRAGCTHPSYFVGNWSWRPGALQVMRICDVCRVGIAGLTDEEATHFSTNMGDGVTITHSGDNLSQAQVDALVEEMRHRGQD